MPRAASVQILVLAVLCGSLAGFCAYWIRGELVKEGSRTLETRHIPCLNEGLASQIAADLQTDAFKTSLATAGFVPGDFQIIARVDGKWVETSLTFRCWGRASYSLAQLSRAFNADDPAARARNDELIARYEQRIREIEGKALGS